MRIMFWNCAIEKEQDISRALKERKRVLSQIALGYSFFLFLRRVKALEMRSHSRQSLQRHSGLSSLRTMTGLRCLGVSLLIVTKTERSHSYIAPNANSRPEIGNAKEQRTSHTGLKSVEDFSPIITLKLALYQQRKGYPFVPLSN